jgi:hypothetical protein
VPAEQLQALAELADRLGVEELCRQAGLLGCARS